MRTNGQDSYIKKNVLGKEESYLIIIKVANSQSATRPPPRVR